MNRLTTIFDTKPKQNHHFSLLLRDADPNSNAVSVNQQGYKGGLAWVVLLLVFFLLKQIPTLSPTNLLNKTNTH